MRSGLARIHPGEVLLKEFVEPAGMQVEDLAKTLHLSMAEVQGILDGSSDVTLDIASKLADALGTTAQFWINLQEASMKLAIEQLKLLSQTEFPSWDEIELLLVQLDDDALHALNEVAARIQSACSCEEEARAEGSSKRKDC